MDGKTYRPISLLVNCSKIFQKQMYSRTSSYLENFGLIYKKQFGVREDSYLVQC